MLRDVELQRLTEAAPAVLARLEHESEAAVTLPLTDAGNAELFVVMFGDLVRFDHARRRWLIWDSHRWCPDDDGAVSRMALKSVRVRRQAAGIDFVDLDHDARKALFAWALRSEGRARLDALLALARDMKPIADSGDGWDATPGLLGAPNGVVDLRTGELRDGKPEDRITMQAAVEYDPAAACPRWERFMHEVFQGDADLVRYVQRALGYSLTAEATEDLLLFAKGRGGNGKSTMFEAVGDAAGDYAREVGVEAFSKRREGAHTTEVADFESGRLIVCEELGGQRLNTDRLKNLTGGGSLRARHIRQDTRQFKQTWQLWLTTNHDPDPTDNTEAWWRRVRIIPFRRRFTEDSTLAGTLRDELPGILRWLVKGAVEWYADGLGELPEAMTDAAEEYRVDVDPLAPLFERGVFIENDEAWTSTEELYDAYTRWANEHLGATLIGRFTESTLGKALSERFEPKRSARDDNGKRKRGYDGVRVGRGEADVVQA